MVKLPGDGNYVIVGVASHTRDVSPDEDDSGPPAYFSYTQNQSVLTDQILLLRTNGDPLALVPALRKVISSIDPDVAIGRNCIYDDLVSDRYVARKLGVLLVTVFSGAALFLSGSFWTIGRPSTGANHLAGGTDNSAQTAPGQSFDGVMGTADLCDGNQNSK